MGGKKKNTFLRDWIEKTDCIEEAKTHKGFIFPIEILLFVIVFIVISITSEYINYFVLHSLLGGKANAEVFDLYKYLTYMVLYILFMKLLQKRSLSSMGYGIRATNPVKEYALGMLGGFVAMTVIIMVYVITGHATFTGTIMFSKIPLLLIILGGYLIQGMQEEVMCRSYFMISVARRSPMWLAIFSNSIIFAALHLLNPGMKLLSFLNIFLYAIFVSICFTKRGSIWYVAAFHSLWNFSQSNIYGQFTSGFDKMTSLLNIDIQGTPMITGGDFGPEASIICTIVSILLILIALKMPSKNRETKTIS